jgi:hypothetical protein
MRQPFFREVSFREAIFFDLVSFVAGILFAFTILCLILGFIYIQFLDGLPPKESPTEILLGYTMITGVFVLILRFRVSRITETLRNGEVVEATILRSLQHQNFVHLSLEYAVRGKTFEKLVWLPATKRPRAIVGEERVLIAVHEGRPKKVIVRDLYE